MVKHIKIFSILLIISGIIYPQNITINKPKIAVLYSTLSERFSAPNSIKILDVITSWELFLMQEKIPYSVIYDDDLESGIIDEFDILILPSVQIISNDEMTELKKFLENGGSIISSGSELFFQDYSLKKYQNLETLLGITNIEPVSSEAISYSHSLIPNNLNYFSGESEPIIQISTKNEALVGGIIGKSVSSCGYTINLDGSNFIKSSLIYGTNLGGRFLWTGFDLNEVIGGKNDLANFKKLISYTINWMDSKPESFISNFSEYISSPVIITLQYNNTLKPELIDFLKRNNINANLIVSPYFNVSREVLAKFDSSEIIYDLSQNSGYTPNNVLELINNFNREYAIRLTTVIIDKQSLDNIELTSIQESGIDKILYYEQIPGVPKFVKNDLLVIPIARSSDIQTSRDVINFLNYYPKNNCDTNTEEEIINKVNQLKSLKYNFTSLILLKKWWGIKEKVTSEIKNISDSQIELLLNNRNSVPLEDLKVFLNYTKKFDNKFLTISLNGVMLEYYLDPTSGAIIINLDKVLPNSINKIMINYSVD